MRKSPTILTAVFLAITLVRVGNFADKSMKAGWLGWIFAAGLGAGVYIAAYYTRISASRDGKEDARSQQLRQKANFALVLFVVIDGLFNLADVLATSRPAYAWGAWLDWVAACAYGLFPTVAAWLLGSLQGGVDRIPQAPAKHKSLGATAREWAEYKLKVPQEPPQPAQAERDEAKQNAFVCVTCGQGFAKQQALAAHSKTHLRVKRNGHEKERVIVERVG